MDSKLALALSLGGDGAVNVKDRPVEAIVEKVREVLGGDPHVTVECTGAEACISLAIKVRKKIFC